MISEEWRRILRRVLEIKFSSLSFHLFSKQVKSRISEDEDENSEGTQAQRQPEFRSSDNNITAIQKVTEKGGPCSTTSNKNTCENNTLHTKSKLSKGLIQLTELITD